VPALRLTNRTEDRAQALKEVLQYDFPAAAIAVLPWEARAAALEGAALCVNTTSLGMKGQPPLDLDLSALPLTSPVADLVYVPLETDLLAAARRRGHPAVDGLGMLLHQAVPGFAHWGGVTAEVDAATRGVLLEALQAR
jgi:shikimate dehydrogenase